MKYRVTNLAGRELGIFRGEDEREAFEAMCESVGLNGTVAEAMRFACFERCVFTEVH